MLQLLHSEIPIGRYDRPVKIAKKTVLDLKHAKFHLLSVLISLAAIPFPPPVIMHFFYSFTLFLFGNTIRLQGKAIVTILRAKIFVVINLHNFGSTKLWKLGT